MPEPKLSFDAWYFELRRLARYYDFSWLVSLDPEAHRQAYLDDLTPLEELSEQAAACNAD